ncbi:MAG: adenylate kinase, adenylate kinase [Candidatus Gottesmanbacteria bacterium GW2011_GWA2_43_14]|uniref:Adenylate kinase n=1 Tax=Candidatus Gottesmanbacteria bacterium GW2011_GWA2_43_14 TaxID=1618443 RepID=A0A0G1DDQ7_9BACT|nr:MAG: adenylate kinase, adenylate kinase [Candidatus Gottesmanbacteria bacterium GW2011_GWA2_43_14]
MHLIIYGPEGSGKGTQAKLLSEHYRLPIITSGDLVREMAERDQSDIGNACRQALKTGTYVSDNVMFEIWRQKLSSPESRKGFILDGFPRNVYQADFLLDQVKKNGYGIDRAVYIRLSDEEAHRRLTKRSRKLFEGSSELHDSPERISHRLQTYRAKEQGTLDFFRKKNLLLDVNGEKEIEKVFKDIIAGLEPGS